MIKTILMMTALIILLVGLGKIIYENILEYRWINKGCYEKYYEEERRNRFIEEEPEFLVEFTDKPGTIVYYLHDSKPHSEYYTTSNELVNEINKHLGRTIGMKVIYGGI